ncbi:LOB domain-containing protein 29-like [Gossypium australe]|uniref:LOB domain-containing protein 29-like n=1 Tax=Gossypium australe TaxID=47621 RepID=A0A5B6VIN2_9ROSI|nr:LOB domain-containing protein 29-like [Gossypium australe]
MTGAGSPCGACKFLRRRCVKGCVFAPYFSHEQGATHFAAIHKVFGASNVSKLLTHLPVNERCEAAVTISYEAQARLQDPIYGCVSHIFALQQQVVNLQAQLACLKEQASSSTFINGTSGSGNPNNVLLQSWFHNNSAMAAPNLNPNLSENGFLDPKMLVNYESSSVISSSSGEDRSSFNAFGEAVPCSMASFEEQWSNFEDFDDLQSMAFGFVHYS